MYTYINAFHMNICVFICCFFLCVCVWGRFFTEKRDSMNKFIGFKKKTEFTFSTFPFLFFSLPLYSFVLFFCPHFLLFMNIVCSCVCALTFFYCCSNIPLLLHQPSELPKSVRTVKSHGKKNELLIVNRSSISFLLYAATFAYAIK